ncbi:WXG100 family type VII secretion target [Mycolicibacterium frederiksbergense]
MALIGADVNQLRDLARLLVQGADRLDGSARTVSSQLGAVRWAGPDGDRYRSQWQGEYIPSIRAVVAGLQQAADLLQRNANEQEQASSSSPGSVSAGVRMGKPSSGSGNGVVDTLGALLSMGGIANDVANAGKDIAGVGAKGVTGVAGAALSGAGVATSLTTMVEGIVNGDGTKTGNGIIGLAGSVVGTFNPALAAAAGAAELYGGMTLPTSAADIDNTLDVGAKRMFGTDTDQLDPQQAAALSRRYEGALGVANMISDSMESKADEAGKFIAGLFGR